MIYNSISYPHYNPNQQIQTETVGELNNNKRSIKKPKNVSKNMYLSSDYQELNNKTNSKIKKTTKAKNKLKKKIKDSTKVKKTNSIKFIPKIKIEDTKDINLSSDYQELNNITNSKIKKNKLDNAKSMISRKLNNKTMGEIIKNIQKNYSKKNINNNELKLLKSKKEKPLNEHDKYILRELKRYLSENHEDAIGKLTGEGLIDPEKTNTTKIEYMKNHFYYNYLRKTPNYVNQLKEYANIILSKFTEIAKNIVNNKKGENTVEKYKNFDENISLLEKESNILNAIAYLNIEKHTAFDQEDTEILFKNIMTIFNNEFSNYVVDYSEHGLKELTRKLKNMDNAIHESMTNTQKDIFKNLEINSCLNITKENHNLFYNALKTAYTYSNYSQYREGCIEKLNEYFTDPNADNYENKMALKKLFDNEIKRMNEGYYKKKFSIEKDYKILDIIFLYLLTATFDKDVEKEILSNKNEDSILEVFLNEFNNYNRLYKNENLIDIRYRNMFSVFISNYSPYKYYIVEELLEKITKNNIKINLNFDFKG